MRVRLYKDWDFFPKIDAQIGYFTGRKSIKERLINEMLRRDSGAILISGSRGVGKTALVHESLSNVRGFLSENKGESVADINEISIKRINKFPFLKVTTNRLGEKALLPILINASQLDLNYASDGKTSKAQLIRKEIIVNLIRGLHAAVKNTKQSDNQEIAKLYKKALATEYKIAKETIDHRTTEYAFEGAIRLNAGLFYAIFFSLLLSVSVYLITGLIPDIVGIYRFLVSAFSFIGISFISFFVAKKIVKSDTEKEIYIRDDNSVTNLEIILDEVLKSLSKYFKPVYIIDELDYFEKSKLNPEPPINVINLIKTYKNLFNLSDAIFIFIAGHTTWNTLQNGDRKDIHSTLFTSSIFLPKPEFSDIRDYIKRISSDHTIWQSSEGKTVLNFLIYKSKAEFFELKNVIANNTVQYLADKRPVLEIDRADGYLIRKAKLQEVIEKLYDFQKFQEFEKNEENYNFIEKIYEVCDLISNKELFYINKKQNSWELSLEDTMQPDYETGHSWFKNLINTLEWLSMIENIASQDTSTDAENISVKNLYRWTGSYRRVPGRINQIETEETKAFKEEFERFSKEMLFVENLYEFIDKGSKAKRKSYSTERRVSKSNNDLVSAITNISVNPLYDDQYVLFRSLESKEVPKYIDAADLKNNTEKLRELRVALLNDKTQLIARIVWESARKKYSDMEFYTANDNIQFLANYPQLVEILKEPAFMLRSGSSGRIILFCSVDLPRLEGLSTSNIMRDNHLRIVNINGNYPNLKLKRASSHIINNVPTDNLNQEILDTSVGKKIFGKISQFMRWL